MTAESLMNACQVNQDWAAICEDPYFWKQKIQHDFGSEVPEWYNTYKPKEQYYYLAQARDPFAEANKGRVDAVIALANQGVWLNRYDATKLSLSGYLTEPTLVWLSLHGIKPYSHINAYGLLALENMSKESTELFLKQIESEPQLQADLRVQEYVEILKSEAFWRDK